MTINLMHRDDDDEHSQDESPELDEFEVIKGKMYRILCRNDSDIAIQVTDGMKDHERFALNIGFHEKKFDCLLLATVQLGRHVSEPKAESYGMSAERRENVAKLNNDSLRNILMKLPDEDREELARLLMDDNADTLVAIAESQGNFGQTEHIREGIREICHRIIFPEDDELWSRNGGVQ